MKAAQIEREVLALPAEQRAHLVLTAWESLVADPVFAADRDLDPEGVKLAISRDGELESGKTKPISHEEFLRRTAKK